jgi:hypothetical protein
MVRAGLIVPAKRKPGPLRPPRARVEGNAAVAAVLREREEGW